MNRRDVDLAAARQAGFHGDSATLLTLLNRRNANLLALNLSFQAGDQAKTAGASCPCLDCCRRARETIA